MPKMEHKINYFDLQPSVQSVELFNLWSMHPYEKHAKLTKSKIYTKLIFLKQRSFIIIMFELRKKPRPQHRGFSRIT